MKRSEAMYKLPIEVTCDTVEFIPNYGSKLSMRCLDRDGNTVHHSVVEGYYSRQVLAARDLLHAEDDAGDELPYKVWRNGVVIAGFRSMSGADAWVRRLSLDGCIITGPTQTVYHGGDDQTESKCDHIAYATATAATLHEFARENAQELCGQDTLPITPDVPRLVPVETERPTLDMMPEWERHLCETPEGGKAWMMSINGYAWFAATPALAMSINGRMAYTVLDADHPTVAPKTVGELEPGLIAWCVDQWCIMLECPMSLYDYGGVPDDTPITGPVYRFDVTD